MKKIILIDDNEMSLVSLRNFLEMEGFSVHAFDCPLKALSASRENSYDLIVSDFRLPHMNGIKLIQDIRSNQPQIKSILVAGYYTDRIVEDARQAGVGHFFPKPIHVTEFMRVIYEMIPGSKINNYI